MGQVSARISPRTGQPEFFSPDSHNWEPLIHGETRISGNNGNPYVWNAEQQTFLPEETLGDSLRRGINSGLAAGARTLADTGIIDDTTAQGLASEGLVKERDNLMPSPEMYTALQEAEERSEGKGWVGQTWEQAKAILGNPRDVGLPLLVESSPSMLAQGAVTAGAAVATRGASIPGQLAATGLAGFGSSMGINYGSQKNELLAQEAVKRGIDPNDANAMVALSRDPEVAALLTQQAASYAAPVAAADALSFGLPLSRARYGAKAAQEAIERGITPAPKTFGKQVAGFGKELGQQVGLAFTGEATGQVASTGEISNPQALAAETVLELFGGVPDILTMKWAGRQPTINEETGEIEPGTPDVTVEQHIDNTVEDAKKEATKKRWQELKASVADVPFRDVVGLAQERGLNLRDLDETQYTKLALKAKVRNQAAESIKIQQEDNLQKQQRYINQLNEATRAKTPAETIEEAQRLIQETPEFQRAFDEKRLMKTGFPTNDPVQEVDRLSKRLAVVEEAKAKTTTELNTARKVFNDGFKEITDKKTKAKKQKELTDAERQKLSGKIAALEQVNQEYDNEAADNQRLLRGITNYIKGLKQQEEEYNAAVEAFRAGDYSKDPRLLPPPPSVEDFLQLPNYTETPTPNATEGVPPISSVEERIREAEKRGWINKQLKNKGLQQKYREQLQLSSPEVKKRLPTFKSFIEELYERVSPSIHETVDRRPITSTNLTDPPTAFTPSGMSTTAIDEARVEAITKDTLVSELKKQLDKSNWFNSLDGIGKAEAVSELYTLSPQQLAEMVTQRNTERTKQVKKLLNSKAKNRNVNESLASVSGVDFRRNSGIINEALKRMGLDDKVTVIEFFDKFIDPGVNNVAKTGDGMLYMSLAHNPDQIHKNLNHEVIHILKDLGIFTPEDWRGLTSQAVKNDWIGKHDIAGRYPDLTNEGMLEEAIAEEFSLSSSKHPLVQRIKEFFKALRRLLTGAFNEDEVFNAILSGTYVKEHQQDALGPLYRGKERNKVLPDVNAPLETKGLRELLDSQQKNSVSWYQRTLGSRLAITTRIPALRKFGKVMRDREQIESYYRQLATAFSAMLIADNKVKTPEAIEKFTKAAIFLRQNKQQLPTEFTKGGVDITTSTDIPGFAKKGDTVTLNEDEFNFLNTEYRNYYNQLADAYGKSTMADLIDKLIDVNSLANIQYTDFVTSPDFGPEAMLTAVERLRESTTADENLLNSLENIANMVIRAKEEWQQSFFTPIIRPSSTFVRIYDYSKPVENPDKVPSYLEPYEVVSVISVPKEVFGSKWFNRTKSLDSWLQQRLAEVKETNPGAELSRDPTKLMNEIVTEDMGEFLGNDSFTIFEKLEALLDPAIDTKKRDSVLAQLRSRMQIKGFANHFKKARLTPGYIHGGNKGIYLAKASASYGNGLGVRVARTSTQPQTIKAMTDIMNGVRRGVYDKNVYDWAKQQLDFVNNPPNDYARIRAASTFYFLSFNPTSAMLQSLQVMQATWPVLTNMFGTGANSFKYASKGWLQAVKGVSWKNLSQGEFINIDGIPGLNKGAKQTLKGLYETRDIVSIVTAELSGSDVYDSASIGGEKTSKYGPEFKQFARKTMNVGMSMISRFEAMNRIGAALSTYNMIQDAKKNPKMFANLKKFLDNSEFDNVKLESPLDLNNQSNVEEICRAVIKFSQGDNSKYNKAAAFRGKYSIPMQFLSFPMQMVDLYLNIFKSALGDVNWNKPDTWRVSNMDPVAAKAFGIMFLGLYSTAGLFGAVPFGDPLRDAYDKIYKYITGIDPDLETSLRSYIASATNPYVAEIAARGLFPSISQRTGVSVGTGVTSGTLMDALGPTGALFTTIDQAHEAYQQGHESLALAFFLPGVFRNSLKALHEAEYGITTGKGNVVPSDYSAWDTAQQIIGFQPADLIRTRTAMYAQQRLAGKTSVLKERYMDNLTTLKVKAILASRNGEGELAREFNKEFADLLEKIRNYNRKASRNDIISINSSTVQRRVLDQLNAMEGITSKRRVPADKRQSVSEAVTTTYPQGYLK